MIQNERHARRVQLESWEVGGELLDILSRGLYSDAKDALSMYRTVWMPELTKFWLVSMVRKQ